MASIPLLRLSLSPTAAVTTTTHNHRRTSHSSTPLFFHPLKSATTTLLPAVALKSKTPKNPRIVAMSSSSTTPATDRLIASIGYFLPFLKGLHYGRFLFAQYPKLSILVEPLSPVFSLYKSVPYATSVAFFAIYFGVVRNPSFSHYVRFNAMQAIVLDVLLEVPWLFQQICSLAPTGLGFKLRSYSHPPAPVAAQLMSFPAPPPTVRAVLTFSLTHASFCHPIAFWCPRPPQLASPT